MIRKSCSQLVIFLLSLTQIFAQEKPVTLTFAQQQSIQKVMQAYDSAGSPGAALLVMDKGKIIYQHA